MVAIEALVDRPDFERLATLSESETLTATILHELTQPLAAATMHIAALKRMAENDGMQIDKKTLSYALERLEFVVKRSTSIISRVRALVIDGRPVRGAVTLATIFDSALCTIEDLPERGRVEIEADSSWAPDPVWCDSVQIEQVLVNLLTNAIVATRSQASRKVVLRAVSRRTLVRGRFIEISVTDNGPGIRTGEEEVLFRPFANGVKGGTGLGLSICRSIVELHGGDIWYEHSQFGGASFHLTLPQARKDGTKRGR